MLGQVSRSWNDALRCGAATSVESVMFGIGLIGFATARRSTKTQKGRRNEWFSDEGAAENY
jgi:hypothetical protein